MLKSRPGGARYRSPAALAAMLALPSVACDRGSAGTKVQAPPTSNEDVAPVFPGAPPWRVVRYTLTKGAKVSLELALDTSLVAGGQGGALPTLVFDLDLAVEDVAANGDYKFRSTIAGVHARDREGTQIDAASVERKLDVLDGVAIVGTLHPDGSMLDPHIDLGGKSIPDALAAQLSSLTQSMQHITTPLPRTPIGVGAIWKSARDVDENGMKV